MSDALLIIAGLVVAAIAFRRRGATSFDPRPERPTGGAPPGPRQPPREGLRQAWREQVAAFRLATRVATAVIIVWMVVVIGREFFF